MAFILCSSLEDAEFDALTITAYGYDVATYDAILAVLTARESVSSARDRLRYYFMAAGVQIAEAPAGKSNIYLGDGLCN